MAYEMHIFGNIQWAIDRSFKWCKASASYNQGGCQTSLRWEPNWSHGFLVQWGAVAHAKRSFQQACICNIDEFGEFTKSFNFHNSIRIANEGNVHTKE